MPASGPLAATAYPGSYGTTVRALAGGWALQGEVHTKWVPVTTTRFSDVAEVSQDG